MLIVSPLPLTVSPLLIIALLLHVTIPFATRIRSSFSAVTRSRSITKLGSNYDNEERRARLLNEEFRRILASTFARNSRFRRGCFRRNKERGKGEEKGRSTRFMYDREPCGSPCDHRLTTRGTRGGMLACWRESFLHFRVSLSYPLCGYSQRCGHIRTEVILFDHHCMERYI